MDRYKGDTYIKLLRKILSILIYHFLSLPKEIQEAITMKYYGNQTSNAWTLKINGFKDLIER